MKRLIFLALCCVFLHSQLAFSAKHALPKKNNYSKLKKPEWMLKKFVALGERDPSRLLKIATALFSEKRLVKSRKLSRLAFEWQHRLAIVSALSQFYDPNYLQPKVYRRQAAEVIKKALHNDPSLIVRDGAVEALRRIFRMDPKLAKTWRAELEKAFFNKKNVIKGQGLFIRETILTAMQEGAIRPNRAFMRKIKRDKNSRVRNISEKWTRTKSFQNKL